MGELSVLVAGSFESYTLHPGNHSLSLTMMFDAASPPNRVKSLEARVNLPMACAANPSATS
jgi:hypothetical protein